MLQAMLGGITGATVRISIDEEQRQFAYGRILEGIAQALNAPAAHVVVHVS
ncbi:hypothetical protein UCMB321_2130 [Pseudomonas batumici]|uniref:Uncharacterized protein n=2 Tax=Pseudomonas batumici TaxID=226910 RepID=A0A0C2IB37_9PSED|nr:hypothetical protein UCMB321_2130 [Pseudomonas batumici]